MTPNRRPKLSPRRPIPSQLIERRYAESATIFCTQYKFEDWHARLGGGVLADSILDRVIHQAISVYAGDLNMGDYWQPAESKRRKKF